MRARPFEFVAIVFVCTLIVPAQADEPAAASDPSTSDRVAAALKLGVPMVTQAATRYPEHRKCFSCHHQTLPMLAMVSAREAGLTVDEAVLKTQAEFTHQSFTAQIETLRCGENGGEGIGGRGLTVSYGLAALALANWPSDETTAAMATYLVKTQRDDGHWKLHATRPPMEDSSETCEALAIAGLQKYAPAEAGETKDQVDAAIVKAKTWLLAATPKSQEDKAALLWGLRLVGASDEDLQTARATVLAAQRDDGGWAQLDEMASDAYATGQTLYLLMATGLPASAPECQRGVEFLLRSQGADGTWHVKTRSTPVQVYFDNGDPHGKDQFISTPATCWALSALGRYQKKP